MLVPMLISIGNAVALTLPLGIYLSKSQGMGPDGLFIAQFVSGAVGTLITGAWLLTGRWTRASPAPQAPSLLLLAHVQERKRLGALSVHEVDLRRGVFGDLLQGFEGL